MGSNDSKLYGDPDVVNVHSAGVVCVLPMPDGGYASGSYDGTIKICSKSGAGRGVWSCKHVLDGHTSYVNCLAMVRDGYIVSGGEEGDLRAWALRPDGSWHCQQVLMGHQDSVNAVAVLPDLPAPHHVGGGTAAWHTPDIASASADGTVKVWEAGPDGTWACKETHKGHSLNHINCLAVLADGSFVTGGGDSRVARWARSPSSGSAPTGGWACRHSVEAPGGRVLQVAALPSDAGFLTADTKKLVTIWRLAGPSGEPTVQQTLRGHDSLVSALAVLPDGGFVSGSWDRTHKVWKQNAKDGRWTCAQTLRVKSYIHGVAVLRDGSIASALGDHTVRVWPDQMRQQSLPSPGPTPDAAAPSVFRSEPAPSPPSAGPDAGGLGALSRAGAGPTSHDAGSPSDGAAAGGGSVTHDVVAPPAVPLLASAPSSDASAAPPPLTSSNSNSMSSNRSSLNRGSSPADSASVVASAPPATGIVDDLANVLTALGLSNHLASFKEEGVAHVSDLTGLSREDLESMGLKRLEINRMFRHDMYLQSDRARVARVQIDHTMEFDAFLAEAAASLGLDASPESLALFMVMPDTRRIAVRKVSAIEPGRELELAFAHSVSGTGVPPSSMATAGGGDWSDFRVVPYSGLVHIRELASGHFGTVTLCSDTLTGFKVAVKSVRGGHGDAAIRREIENLRSVPPSPALVQVLGVCEDHPHGIAIVMQFCKHGSLRSYINDVRKRREKLPFEFARRILRQAAGGIALLHSLPTGAVIHRDIRAANILLDSIDATDPVAKVTDFGLSHTMDVADSGVSGTVTIVGPIPWMAPETLRGMESDATKQVVSAQTDVYMFGTVMFEVLTGDEPFCMSSIRHLQTLRREDPTVTALSEWRSRQGFGTDDNTHWAVAYEDEALIGRLVAIMESCWAVNPADRPSMAAIATQLDELDVATSYYNMG